MASEETVRAACGAGFGSLGPIGLPFPVVVDRSAAQLADFSCGANEDGYHCTGVNWDRDCPLGDIADLREVCAGDPSPDGTGTLDIKRGIEVGHIFQLGTKYSEAMNATVLNENGKNIAMTMGCYGIGSVVSWLPLSSRITMTRASFGPARWHRSRLQSSH